MSANDSTGGSNSAMQRVAENWLLKLAARIFQVVGVPVGVALMVFYLQSGAEERKSIDKTLSDLNSAVAVLQDRTGSIYTQADARADFEQRDNQIGDLRNDIGAVNGRVDGNTHRIEALEQARARRPH